MTRDERAAARRASRAPLEPPTVGASVAANARKAGDETPPVVPSIEAIELFVGDINKQFEDLWDGGRSATDKLRRLSPIKDAPR
eukprot:8131226-Lingulodinium_polyedra.AAC.1